MSRIRDLIREDTKQNEVGINSVENSYLKTTDKLLIGDDNRVLLPSIAIGDIVWNMAVIFNEIDSYVIEKEVTVSTNGSYLIFEDSDDVKGKYCIVSYLTYKVTV